MMACRLSDHSLAHVTESCNYRLKEMGRALYQLTCGWSYWGWSAKQSLLVVHAIANASVLPSREHMLEELVEREGALWREGLDPYYVGHRLVAESETDHDYQDALVEYLKDVGALPKDGRKFVEPWRRLGRGNSRLLGRAWERVKELSEEEKWLEGVTTEEEWADLMERLAEWQRVYEEKHGEHPTEGQSVWYL